MPLQNNEVSYLCLYPYLFYILFLWSHLGASDLIWEKKKKDDKLMKELSELLFVHNLFLTSRWGI